MDVVGVLTGWMGIYAYMLPEIIVTCVGLAILVLDLVLPERYRSWLGYFAIAGLIAASLATVPFHGSNKVLFQGIFHVDSFAVWFKQLFINLAVVCLIFSVQTIRKVSPFESEYYALIVFATLGNMVVAASAELFTIFLALQLTSLPLIVLIAYRKNDPKSTEAGVKYLIMVLISTSILLYGMTLIYGATGTSTILEIGHALAAQTSLQPVLVLGVILLLTGFAFKVTAAPFHFWVPDVYEGAPDQVTAFLSTASKFAGFALAMRLVVTGLKLPIDWTMLFAVMAVASMVIGNFSALLQTNIKRMLAYSGIAQVGYILVGMAALTPMGIASVLFYAAGYSVTNLAAFGVVILVTDATGSSEIKDYAGLSKRAPLAALAMTIALFSLAGLPLFAGFVNKFFAFAFAVEKGLTWLVAIAVVNSVVALFYYLQVIREMYVSEPAGGDIPVPWTIGLGLSICVAAIVWLGIYPEPVFRLGTAAANMLFGE